jgi:hypothetical protein
MNFSDGESVDQFKDLRAQVRAAREQYDLVIERYQNFKANFGVKEKSDGSIVIDYDKFVERLGVDGCLELRKIIDEKHGLAPIKSSVEMAACRYAACGKEFPKGQGSRHRKSAQFCSDPCRTNHHNDLRRQAKEAGFELISSGGTGEKPRVRVKAATQSAA